MRTLAELMNVMPQTGRIAWIGLRPAKHADMIIVNQVEAEQDKGLVGDRYSSHAGKRQVTLIQNEHLQAIASIMNIPAMDPILLKRNIVVSGINLLALKGRTFRVGSALFEYTGLCHPCSRMEQILGPGGYNAMRGHGGITAKVIASGLLAVESEVVAED